MGNSQSFDEIQKRFILTVFYDIENGKAHYQHITEFSGNENYVNMFDVKKRFISIEFAPYINGANLNEKLINIPKMFEDKTIYFNTIKFVNNKYNYSLMDMWIYSNGQKLYFSGLKTRHSQYTNEELLNDKDIKNYIEWIGNPYAFSANPFDREKKMINLRYDYETRFLNQRNKRRLPIGHS
jgi:hypothetical protein